MHDKSEPLSVLDRRRLLLGGAVSALATGGLAGCATCRTELPGAKLPVAAVADAHVHLFSAADLPVVSFVKYVIVPNHLGELGDTAQAIVDIVASALKGLGLTARQELRLMPPIGRPRGDLPSPEDFGKAVADRVEGLRATQALQDDLLRSYLELTVILGAVAAPQILRSQGDLGPLTAERILSRGVVESVFTAFAAQIEEGEPFPTPSRHAIASLIELTALDPDYVAHLLGWVFLMLKPRCRHLSVYMERFLAAGDAQPRTLVNHLVDYDAWLDEGPRRNSGHEEQITLWAAYRGRYKDQIDLHTFAGVCPLKQAYDVARGVSDTHYHRLQRAWDEGRVQGFKIYPPMGFKPIGNAAETDDFWRSPNGVGSRVIDRWNAAGFGKPLGVALDECLRDFYRWCSHPDRDIPIMSHAGWGNEAGEGWGLRANPKYWRDVVDEFGDLRLDLGHFCEDAGEFIKAVAGLPTARPVWPMDGTKDLIRDGARQSRVFADLGYMSELLTDRPQAPDLAMSFFLALREYCRRYDPDFSQIMFGSDWIMLGQERNNENYLPIMRAGFRRAMETAEFPPDAMDRIFLENARRFLKLAP